MKLSSLLSKYNRMILVMFAFTGLIARMSAKMTGHNWQHQCPPKASGTFRTRYQPCGG